MVYIMGILGFIPIPDHRNRLIDRVRKKLFQIHQLLN